MILLSLQDIRAGMLLGVGLRSREGHTLLGAGTVLTEAYVARLHGLGYSALWIDDEDTRDIPYEEVLSETTRHATAAVVQRAFTVTAREGARLAGVSVDEVRRALESRRTREIFRDFGAVERLTGPLELVLNEILGRPVLTGLGSLRLHDKSVFDHCLDVTVTATTIGRMLGFGRETLKKLAVGTLLHDLGIALLDRNALDGAGPARADDDRLRRDHPVLGYLCIRDALGLPSVSAHVAYQHHERQDGAGFPRGLTGTNRVVEGFEVPGRLSVLGEVAAIADFYDICSAARPDGTRLAPDQVWQAVSEAAGASLNREIVRRFLASLPPYPLGTQVRVISGRFRDHLGVVARLAADALDRPVVRLLQDPSGARIPPVELDLQREEGTVQGVLGRSTVPSEVAS